MTAKKPVQTPSPEQVRALSGEELFLEYFHLPRARGAGPPQRSRRQAGRRTYTALPQGQFSVVSLSTTAVYTVTPIQYHCTCPGFLYSRYPNKTCVHLVERSPKRWPVTAVFSSRTTVPFQLVGDSWPARGHTSPWLMTPKVDGVRVAVRPDWTVLTRSGLVLSHLSYVLSRSGLPRPPATLDCELTTMPEKSKLAGHDAVMAEIVHASERPQDVPFQLVVLDLFLTRGEPRYARLNRAKDWTESVRPSHLFRILPEGEELSPQVDDRGAWLQILLSHLKAAIRRGEEGLVCHAPDGEYQSGRRDRRTCFKLKAAHVHLLQNELE